MDFEGMGLALGCGRAIRQARATTYAWQDRAEALERELALARAEAAAQDAGRRAQLAALRAAMDAVAPFDPVLRRTGRMYEEGIPERVYEAAYAPAYDAVARREGLPPAQRPMTKEERAAAAEAEVLAEPVTVRRWLLLGERVFWRGHEYRTEAGAVCARAAAARARTRRAAGVERSGRRQSASSLRLPGASENWRRKRVSPPREPSRSSRIGATSSRAPIGSV